MQQQQKKYPQKHRLIRHEAVFLSAPLCWWIKAALCRCVYSLVKRHGICTNDAVIYILMKRFITEPLALAAMGIHCLICLQEVFSSPLILIKKSYQKQICSWEVVLADTSE